MTGDSRKKALGRLPTHLVLIGLISLWVIPALGLLVTSFRPFQQITSSGWWTVMSPQPGEREYTQFCAECHGSDGAAIAAANLADPALIAEYNRSLKLLGSLRSEINGAPHMGDQPLPDPQQAADIIGHVRTLAGLEAQERFTTENYINVLTGYRGTASYSEDCASGQPTGDLTCDLLTDITTNQRGMGRAFLNSLLVAIPSTILPILFAAFAAYAFAWFDFRGRHLLFALLVALQIVPLQMTLVPIQKLYAQMGMNPFLGIWLFHTGFGLPYAIYLMRNFLSALPRDLFESAYLDGASHWTAFTKLAIPLATPAIASLAIFQFLWIWNDLLVALVFLGSRTPVVTYIISNLVTSRGQNWHLLTAGAFISILLPMLVFFAFQRYFVRGLLAGSVKG